ncbi:MAG: 50S ribosomal protein L10 [Bryobacteraceae bacterium]|nr:50S ribosomal protein L10 [Bryobacteraceae bacterium]
MKDRKKKKQELESLEAALKEADSFFVGTFNQLTVAQDFELRKTVRNAGGQYRVVKNTLAEKASAGAGSESVLKGMKGTSALALTSGDPVALAKALSTYAKGNPAFSFKAGFVQGRVIDLKDIEILATMPSKEEIYAKLLYLINAPAQRLATVVNAVGRNLAVVIDQGVKENRFSS